MLGEGEGTTTAIPSAEATVLRKPLGLAGVVSILGREGILADSGVPDGFLGCLFLAPGGRPRLRIPENELGSVWGRTTPVEGGWGVLGVDSCDGLILLRFKPELIHELSTFGLGRLDDSDRSDISGTLLRCGPRSLGGCETPDRET